VSGGRLKTACPWLPGAPGTVLARRPASLGRSWSRRSTTFRLPVTMHRMTPVGQDACGTASDKECQGGRRSRTSGGRDCGNMNLRIDVESCAPPISGSAVVKIKASRGHP
jgi:hypothetical protein